MRFCASVLSLSRLACTPAAAPLGFRFFDRPTEYPFFGGCVSFRFVHRPTGNTRRGIYGAARSGSRDDLLLAFAFLLPLSLRLSSSPLRRRARLSWRFYSRASRTVPGAFENNHPCHRAVFSEFESQERVGGGRRGRARRVNARERKIINSASSEREGYTRETRRERGRRRMEEERHVAGRRLPRPRPCSVLRRRARESALYLTPNQLRSAVPDKVLLSLERSVSRGEASGPPRSASPRHATPRHATASVYASACARICTRRQHPTACLKQQARRRYSRGRPANTKSPGAKYTGGIPHPALLRVLRSSRVPPLRPPPTLLFLPRHACTRVTSFH